MTEPAMDLDAIEARVNAASPGPWGYDSYSGVFSGPKVKAYDEWLDSVDDGHSMERHGRCDACGQGAPRGCRLFSDAYKLDPLVAHVPAHHGDTATGTHAADAAFIAAARADVPALAAEVRRLRAELDQVKAQLAVVQRDRDTFQQVARKNKAHTAVLAEVIERVGKFADEMGNYRSPHGVAATYADRLRERLNAPTSFETAGRLPGLPGDRVEDGGVWGTLVRCGTCGGDGLLHKPDRLPPSPAPQESPQPVREPDGCPVPQWDGPYQFRCSLGASVGVCHKHGRFRDDKSSTSTPR